MSGWLNSTRVVNPSDGLASWSTIGPYLAVPAAASLTLDIDAQADANNEADNFEFSYSINGSAYVQLDTLMQGSGRLLMSALLPAGTSGTVGVGLGGRDSP